MSLHCLASSRFDCDHQGQVVRPRCIWFQKLAVSYQAIVMLSGHTVVDSLFESFEPDWVLFVFNIGSFVISLHTY